MKAFSDLGEVQLRKLEVWIQVLLFWENEGVASSEFTRPPKECSEFCCASHRKFLLINCRCWWLLTSKPPHLLPGPSVFTPTPLWSIICSQRTCLEKPRSSNDIFHMGSTAVCLLVLCPCSSPHRSPCAVCSCLACSVCHGETLMCLYPCPLFQMDHHSPSAPLRNS